MSVRVAVLTVSDGCAAGTRDDRSGDAVCDWVREAGHALAARSVVPDDALAITTQLIVWPDAGVADVILTIGGTGFGPRDVTPEATRAAITRDATALAEYLRRSGAEKNPRAVLSRGIAGTRAASLIVNLPGSTAGAIDGVRALAPLIEHIAALLAGDTEH